ncbi:hypothetical protein A9A89_0579 [Bifidobacterium psychraerophilum DSM 22366]|jgi:hypothetical protein|nr:hypothetical protein A9A89_0579 [Bifidobacterium psychraerophilum DSM 22366]
MKVFIAIITVICAGAGFILWKASKEDSPA